MTLLAAAAPAVDLRAQRDDPDPYTRNGAAELERAGYVRIGHTTWADGHGTQRIQEDLGRIPIHWIETEHFKLGCGLPAQAMPRDKDDRKKLLAELGRLAERIPDVKPRSVRTLDPWLRAHLFAMRLEELYANVVDLCGASDVAFPPADAPYFRRDAPADQKWLGRGPFLGIKSKFLVLLCEKPSSVARYLTTYTGAAGDMPSRWYFETTDAFLFATAQGFADGAFRDDRAMHAHVVFNVAHNLIDAYRGYSYLVPVWWKEGLAHRLRRRVSIEHNNFSGIDDRGRRAYVTFDWETKLRQRAGHDLVRPLDEIADATDCDGFTLIDHLACWSRVSWMLEAFPPDRFAQFVDTMKGLVDELGRAPAPDAMARIQREALETAFGADVDGLERSWLAWIAKTYRGR